jgi:hypothetical protein
MSNTGRMARKRRNRTGVLSAVAAALFLFGLGGAVVSAVASSDPEGITAGASPAPDATGLLAIKQNAVQEEADARSSAMLSAPPKVPGYTPSAGVVADRTSEINDAHQSPLPASQFEVSNAWSGPSPVAGQWWVVYAGASRISGAAVPSLLVYAEPEDPNQADQFFKQVGVFDDPLAAAPLHIVSASGTKLTLDALPFPDETATDSTAPGSATSSAAVALQTLTFDLSSRLFAVL